MGEVGEGFAASVELVQEGGEDRRGDGCSGGDCCGGLPGGAFQGGPDLKEGGADAFGVFSFGEGAVFVHGG